jgi:hypothetical protein
MIVYAKDFLLAFLSNTMTKESRVFFYRRTQPLQGRLRHRWLCDIDVVRSTASNPTITKYFLYDTKSYEPCGLYPSLIASTFAIQIQILML